MCLISYIFWLFVNFKNILGSHCGRSVHESPLHRRLYIASRATRTEAPM